MYIVSADHSFKPYSIKKSKQRIYDRKNLDRVSPEHYGVKTSYKMANGVALHEVIHTALASSGFRCFHIQLFSYVASKLSISSISVLNAFSKEILLLKVIKVQKV